MQLQTETIVKPDTTAKEPEQQPLPLDELKANLDEVENRVRICEDKRANLDTELEALLPIQASAKAAYAEGLRADAQAKLDLADSLAPVKRPYVRKSQEAAK